MERKKKMRFIFNRRHNASEDKAAPIELEIYFNRKERKIIPTELSIYLGQWDGHVVNHLQAKLLNKQLDEFINKYQALAKSIEVRSGEFTLDALNERLGKTKVNTSVSFIDFMITEIERRQLRPQTKRMHYVALESLKRFGRIHNFEDLTPENIKKYDRFLRDEDPTRCQTTLHGYHKRIKPYVIEAYKLRHIDFNPYIAFDDVRGSSKERNPLTQEELEHLRIVELPEKLDRVRDLFVFGCYTGLAYSDICLFRYETDVVHSNGMCYIDGERIKTGTKFYTPLLNPALSVLEKYQYRLPIISLQRYNDYLHLLEIRLDLNKTLTSHIARHTFATTVTLANDVPIESVSRMLGHKSITTTQIYAKILKTTIERHAEVLAKII